MIIKWKPLIANLAISMGVGLLSVVLTMNSMKEVYAELNKPPLSPPAWVFGVVWTILFLLMGISAYLVYTSDANADRKRNALVVYGVQLIFNLLWSVFFFDRQWYWFSFAWLIVLWFLILTMIVMFSNISRKAALLQIPYLLWVTFAGYLTAGVAMLN
uniref:TspO/MBR family protein n=1 Tax=Candidatus Fimivicinus sp. TaxID=3056640 RepID=UPI003FF095E6